MKRIIAADYCDTFVRGCQSFRRQIIGRSKITRMYNSLNEPRDETRKRKTTPLSLTTTWNIERRQKPPKNYQNSIREISQIVTVGSYRFITNPIFKLKVMISHPTFGGRIVVSDD